MKGLFSDPSPILNRPQLIDLLALALSPSNFFYIGLYQDFTLYRRSCIKSYAETSRLISMGFPLTVLVRPSSRLVKSNSLSLYTHAQEATHLVRRQSFLVSLPPCLRFSSLPLCSNFFSSVFSVVHPPTAVLSVLRSQPSSDLLAAWIRSDPSPCCIFQFFGCVSLAALLLPPSSFFVLFRFVFVFCVSFAALLPPQRYYLPLSLVDYFEPSPVTLIGCIDPAISRHRSASCVADLRLHRLHQIASAPIPGQPQQPHQSCRVHVSISRFF